MGDISIPLQFVSLYDGQEVFVWLPGKATQISRETKLRFVTFFAENLS